jgi:histidinol-phosphatase (PHP family)
MIADYHIHTSLCGHAEGEPREYVERAIKLGMTEMGFSDHLPLLAGWEPGFTMRREDLDGYVTTVQDLAAEYAAEIRILLGIEVDYLVAIEESVLALLAQYPFDYAIGSVHELADGFIFDHARNRDAISVRGVDAVYLESYALIERAAATRAFRILGHLDLAKKFGHRPDDAEAVAAAASSALRAVKQAGAAIELNTAGWRKPVGEAYPAPDLLAAAADLDIPLTLGSDAHRPDEVGADFARAAALAGEAGYSALLRLSDSRPQALE